MSLRAGTYIVPTHRWYIERTVWLIAGFALLTSTALALLVDPLWILGVTATGLVSINVALTGFCASTFCKSIAGISSAASTSRWASIFLLPPSSCWRRVHGGRYSRFSSAAPWSGSRRPATASWPTRSTGLAPNLGSIPTPCRPAAVKIVPCRTIASATRGASPQRS